MVEKGSSLFLYYSSVAFQQDSKSLSPADDSLSGSAVYCEARLY